MKTYEYISIAAGLCTGVAFVPQLIKAICLGGKDSALSNLGLGIYSLGLILWIVWGSMLLRDTLNDDQEGYNGLVSVVFSCVGLTAVLLTLTFNIESIRNSFYGKYNKSIESFCKKKKIQGFLNNF